MYRVGSVSQYLNLICVTTFELEEMAYRMGEDLEDELDDLSPRCQEIAEYLKTVRQDIKSAAHDWDIRELEYVSLARRLRNVLPFYPLPRVINRIHFGRELQA
ncbi:MAG: hypothetical protein WBM41_05885 [Arenicellales bacterium]